MYLYFLRFWRKRCRDCFLCSGRSVNHPNKYELIIIMDLPKYLIIILTTINWANSLNFFWTFLRSFILVDNIVIGFEGAWLSKPTECNCWKLFSLPTNLMISLALPTECNCWKLFSQDLPHIHLHVQDNVRRICLLALTNIIYFYTHLNINMLVLDL